MKISLFLLLFTFSSFAFAESTQTSENQELELLPTHEIDIHQYAHTTLTNGLSVLLISNKLLNNEIQLKVMAGGSDDPKEFQGIAHLLEHLVHLGSQNYPGLHDYRNFVEGNNGKITATTHDTHTIYKLAIENRHFEEGVRRFADMLFNPELSKSSLVKEINAVHSEYELKKTYPNFLLARVNQETAFVDSELATFVVGNKQSLPDSQLTQIHHHLVRFFKEHYHAENMFLILRSKASLEDSLALVKGVFGNISSEATSTKQAPGEFNVRQKISINTPDNLPSLLLQFPVSQPLPLMSNREYLAKALFNIQNENSLGANWKHRDWITNTEVISDMTESPENPMIGFRLFLTPSGISQQTKILQDFFSYNQRLTAVLASESQDEELNAHIEGFEKKGTFLFKTSSDILKYFGHAPIEKLLYRDPFTQTLAEFIGELNPENLRLWQINLGNKTDKRTQFDAAEYGIESITDEEISSWITHYNDFVMPYQKTDPKQNSSAEKRWKKLGFAFRDSSEYEDALPEDVNPEILSSVAVTVWLDTPWHGDIHGISSRLRAVNLPNKKDYLLRQIWLHTTSNQLRQLFNQHCPHSDVNTCSVSFDEYGNLLTSFLSTSNLLPQTLSVLENAISEVFNSNITEDDFNTAKEQFLAQKDFGDPINASLEVFSMALVTGDLSVTGKERNSLLKTLTFEDFTQFLNQFVPGLQPDFLFNSSVTDEFTENFARHIVSEFTPTISKASKLSVEPVFSKAENKVISQTSLHQTPSHTQLFISKDMDYKDVVYSHVLADRLQTAFHNEMRTEQQLGYVAMVRRIDHFHRPILTFYVQHDHDTKDVDTRINEFQKRFLVELKNTDAQEINKWIRHTVDKLMPMATKDAWLRSGYTHQPDTFMTEEKLESFFVNKQKAAELIQFYEDLISVNGRAKFEISSGSQP